MDFGLARAFAGERAELNLSNSPTLTRSPTLSDMATQQGVILGTAAYMSPEQARGKSVDKRADIWAFGCVLYEMLTGRVAFSGQDVTDILAAVIRAEPDWGNLPANLHWRLREVIEDCLKKESKDRYHDISDVRVDIQKVLADPSGVLVQPTAGVESKTRLRTMLPWIAAIILTAIIAGVAVWKLKPPEPKRVIRFDYELPEGQQINGGLAVSPDGRQFVYSTSKGLYLRSMDESTAKVIAGIEEDVRQPFFSPDGKWIGYYSVADRKLKKININGGDSVALGNLKNFLGASWIADDIIVYSTFENGIMRIPANGGTPESIIKPRPETLSLPQILPDGRSVLYTAIIFNPPAQKIMIQSLKSGEPKELFAGNSARYLPTGHIVYKSPNNNNLFAIPFDLDRLEVKGGAVPIAEGVGNYAVSDSGTLGYISATSVSTAAGKTLVWVNREGKEEALHTPQNNYLNPKISPDGKRLAVAIPTDGIPQIWIWDLAGETMTRLTFDKSNSLRLIWTPDGKRIAFTSLRDGKYSIYWKAADGTGEVEKLGAAPDRNLLLYSLSSDGKTLAIEELNSAMTHSDIGTLSMEGDHFRKLLLHEEYTEAQPNISPDGKYLAYLSDESGQTEVYVRPFPEVNRGKWQISAGGGEDPLWSPDSRELFYRRGGAVMAVPVDTKSTFSAGKPRMLFQGMYVTGTGQSPAWDISPDGKRFLMIKRLVSTAAAPAAGVPRKINIVLNWFEELKARVPVK